MKFRLQFPLFYITLERNNLKITTEDNVLDNSKLTPQQWSAYWKAVLILSEGPGVIEVNTQKYGLCLTHEFEDGLGMMPADLAKKWRDLCDRASYLFAISGTANQPTLSLDELAVNEQRITCFNAIVQREVVQITVPIDGDFEIEPMDALIFDYLQLGSAFLICCARARATPEQAADGIGAQNYGH